MSGSLDDKKAKRAPLRSSIACLRCRKSKIKCDNQGPTGPCDGCLKAGRDCQYPEAVPVPPKRHEASPSVKRESTGGPDRKRVKKIEDVSRSRSDDATEFAEEVLSANYLSPTIWSQVFDLYRQNYATELPFLHLPTLKAKVGNKLRVKLSPGTNLVLLGILTLTARFHSDIVKYVANSSGRTPVPGSAKNGPVQTSTDEAAASDYFEQALVTALGPQGTWYDEGTLEKVQAFLMLGLYNWMHSKPKGLTAWMYFGSAIRMAQALRLGFGDKDDKEKAAQRARGPTRHSRAHITSSQAIVDKEIRRRTMFSCFILDRVMACGNDRPMAILSEDMQIQLPCSDQDFDLAVGPETSYLGDPGPTKGDSVLACFIRLIHIWGGIIKFSFAGGRRSEKEGVAPWHEASRFRQLRQELWRFFTDLPEVYQLSLDNFHRHDNHQATNIYVSLHMLGCLCNMMLHREYIPYIAFRCPGPIGPIDEPIFPKEKFKVPDGFWEESATQVFRAAKDIVELIDLCGGKLPMSPLVIFPIHTAAFVGIYAHHYSHMDQKGHMLSTQSGDPREMEVDIKTSGPTSVAYQTLLRMSPWLNLASNFVQTFHDMDKRYYKYDDEFRRHVGKNLSVRGHRLSVLLGGDGGGLEEWKVHGLKVVNNGSIYAGGERPEAAEDQSDCASSVEVLENPHAATTTARTPRSVVSGSFTAINTGSNRSATQLERQDVLQPPHHQAHSMMPAPPVEHRSGGLSTDANWRVSHDEYQGAHYQPAGYAQQQQQQQQQHPSLQHTQQYQHQSQTQEQHQDGGYAMVEHSPQIAGEEHEAGMEHNDDCFNRLLAIEHGPWYMAPGGLESLATNTMDGPHIFMDSMYFPMVTPVEGYQ